jgi:hypothetical protein
MLPARSSTRIVSRTAGKKISRLLTLDCSFIPKRYKYFELILKPPFANQVRLTDAPPSNSFRIGKAVRSVVEGVHFERNDDDGPR